MRIRNLKIEDYEEILKLWDRARLSYRPRGRDSYQEVKRQMENDPDLFLGAEEEGKLVGVVIATYDGRKGWLNRITVDPAYRGNGLGLKLTRVGERVLRKKGAKIIALLVERSNLASLNLAQKAGYVIAEDILYLTKRESEEV
jgi:ribosomal protein S18 acetylase RimI-like enzyme